MKTTTKKPPTGKAKPKPNKRAKKPPATGTTGKRKERGLNVRQERFAELVAGGMVATQAYMKAGYSKDLRIAEANACRVMDNDGVKARIALLRAPETQAARYSKEEKLAFLASIMRTPVGEIGPDSPLCSEFTEDLVAGGSRGKLRRGPAASGNEVTGETILRRKIKGIDKLRALELHSKLVGDFVPERVEIETGPKTLEALELRAAAVVSALDLSRR